MFHRELKINYGMLGDLISNIESYQSALSVMKQSVEKCMGTVRGKLRRGIRRSGRTKRDDFRTD